MSELAKESKGGGGGGFKVYTENELSYSPSAIGEMGANMTITLPDGLTWGDLKVFVLMHKRSELVSSYDIYKKVGLQVDRWRNSSGVQSLHSFDSTATSVTITLDFFVIESDDMFEITIVA